MRSFLGPAVAAASALASPSVALTVTPSGDAAALVSALVDPAGGLTVLSGSESYTGAAAQSGIFTGFSFSNSRTSVALGDGIVMTTGDAAGTAVPANTDGAFGVDHGAPGDADLSALLAAGGAFSSDTFDAAVLSFDFTVDPGITSVSVSFVFGTEEYPSQAVSDPFGFFLDGVNYASFSDGSLINLGPAAGTLYLDNRVGTADPFLDGAGASLQYNGFTSVITVTGLLDPGVSTHTLKVAVADMFDGTFDSGLFLSGVSAGTGSAGGFSPDPSVYIPVPAGLPLLFGGLVAMAGLRRLACARPRAAPPIG